MSDVGNFLLLVSFIFSFIVVFVRMRQEKLQKALIDAAKENAHQVNLPK